MTGCVFCGRISAGEYDTEDEFAVMFQPLNPVTAGHWLAVPKIHVRDAMTDPLVTAMTMRFAAEQAYRQAVGACNLITSCGREATQSVFHLHIHIVPRRENDDLHLPWTGQLRKDNR